MVFHSLQLGQRPNQPVVAAEQALQIHDALGFLPDLRFKLPMAVRYARAYPRAARRRESRPSVYAWAVSTLSKWDKGQPGTGSDPRWG